MVRITVFFFFFFFCTWNSITILTFFCFIISILLIRWFSCFVFNFWRTKIFSYKFWNNKPFNLIFFLQKKQKNVKIVILSHIQKEKKNFILTTHLYSNYWFLSVFVIYLNSNTSIIFIKTKKKTKLLLPKKKPHYLM